MLKHLSLAHPTLHSPGPPLGQIARHWQGFSMERLSLHAYNVRGSRFGQPTSQLGSITALQLTRCPVDRLGIHTIFNCCPRLTSLSIVSPEQPYTTISMTEIGHALRDRGRSLTDLAVAWLDWSATSWPYWRMSEDDKYSSTEWDEDPPMPVEGLGSLQELSNLRVLTITMWELLGVDIVMDARTDGRHLIDLLPSNLRKLTIPGCNKDNPGKICAATNRNLRDLVRSERFTSLQTVVADMPREYACDVGPDWKHAIGNLDKRLASGYTHVRHMYWRTGSSSSQGRIYEL